MMNIPESIRTMLQMLMDAGFPAHLVGGCVRDGVMGNVPHDYDITTSARPEQIMEIFGKDNCTEYGRAFGTVGVKCAGGFAEITTYRTEADYADSRHPSKVDFANHIDEDLCRRDFTCNAMAYSLDGGLYDPFGGREDIENKVLRCVGTPEARFHEDALRIMRGMRFAARYGFTPEPVTAAAMHSWAFRLDKISAERIMSELQGMLMGEHITKILLAFPDVLAVRIPEITPCIAFDQHTRHHDFTVWEHTARAVGNAPKDPVVRMAMLWHDIAKPLCYSVDARGGHFDGHAEKSAEMADAILHRLKSENKFRMLVVELIRLHREIPDTLEKVRRLLGVLDYEEYQKFLCVLTADNTSKFRNNTDPVAAEKIEKAKRLAEQCIEQNLCCRLSQLAVKGGDLAALGLRGEAIGEALHKLLEAVVSDTIPNEKEQLLAYLQS